MRDINKETKLVPKLRFKEFTDTWSSTTLGKTSKFTKGKNISKSDISEDGSIECIRYGELYTHYKELVEEIVSRTNLSKSDLVLSETHDILIPASGETAIDISTASCLLKEDVALGGDINIVKTPEYGPFLTYYLKHKKKYDIARVAQGNSVVHLYPHLLKSLKVHFPSKVEQQKIASFLTAVDKRIEQLTKKKKLLEEYKKGVMQKIFNQEIRFKDENGKDFPEWEEKRLGDILKLTLRPSDKPKENYLSIGIRSHGKGTFQKPDTNPNSISIDTLYQVKKGDLIVNITFAWEGAIAIVKADDDGGYVSHRFPTYTIRNDGSTPDYLEHVIKGKRFKYLLSTISPGGAGRNRVLNRSDFLKLKIKLPNIDEQITISNLLNGLDKQVDQLILQLDKENSNKKALLQQMFI